MRRPALAAVAGLVLVTACGGPAPPTPAVVERVVELGPIHAAAGDAGSAPTLREPLEPAGLGWITGVRVDAPAGIRVTDAGITLDVEIDVIRASDDAPEVRLPEGFGVPVLQIRGELPPRWRSLHVTARAFAGAASGHDAALRVRVTGLGPTDPARVTPLWRVPIAIDAGFVRPASTAGPTTVRTALLGALPAPGIIHAVVPRTLGSATEIRIVRTGEHTPLARLVRADATRPLGVWTDPDGIVVAADRDVELEVDLARPARSAMTVDVYVRPADGSDLRYPEAVPGA